MRVGKRKHASSLPPHGGITPVSLFKSRVRLIEIRQNDVEGARKESSSEHVNGEEFVGCSSFTASFHSIICM